MFGWIKNWYRRRQRRLGWYRAFKAAGLRYDWRYVEGPECSYCSSCLHTIRYKELRLSPMGERFYTFKSIADVCLRCEDIHASYDWRIDTLSEIVSRYGDQETDLVSILLSKKEHLQQELDKVDRQLLQYQVPVLPAGPYRTGEPSNG